MTEQELFEQRKAAAEAKDAARAEAEKTAEASRVQVEQASKAVADSRKKAEAAAARFEKADEEFADALGYAPKGKEPEKPVPPPTPKPVDPVKPDAAGRFTALAVLWALAMSAIVVWAIFFRGGTHGPKPAPAPTPLAGKLHAELVYDSDSKSESLQLAGLNADKASRDKLTALDCEWHESDKTDRAASTLLSAVDQAGGTPALIVQSKADKSVKLKIKAPKSMAEVVSLIEKVRAGR